MGGSKILPITSLQRMVISLSRQMTLVVLRKIDGILSSTVKIICVILLIAIVATISVSVFTRFVIFYPLNFADALAKYLMMWMAFLGSGLAIKEGEHIVVNMFVEKLGSKGKRTMLLITNVVVSAFLIVVIYYGYLYALSGKGSHDPFVFGISMMIPYLSVPIGACYMLIQINLTTFIQMLTNKVDDGQARLQQGGF